MRSAALKQLYYLTVGKFSIFSYLWHRFLLADNYRECYVQIASGRDYVDGMVNIDGNVFHKKDIWLDITLGLPFFDNCIAGIYASHIMEHFSVSQIRRIFAEYRRVLKPGAALRIVVPSLEFAIEAYTQNRPSDLPDWPEHFQSLGGRLNNYLLCANQHRVMFDFSFLEEILSEAGFQNICRVRSHESRHFRPEHMAFEKSRSVLDRSLYVEALKPAREIAGAEVEPEQEEEELSAEMAEQSEKVVETVAEAGSAAQEPQKPIPEPAEKNSGRT